MANDKKTSVIVSVIVAVIAGAFAAAPGLYASYVNTPQQIKAELNTVLLQSETQIELQTNEIEAELNRILQQSEIQIQLQRDKEVATILARLDDPRGHVRTGAALSLGALGGEEIRYCCKTISNHNWPTSLAPIGRTQPRPEIRRIANTRVKSWTRSKIRGGEGGTREGYQCRHLCK